LPEAKSDFDKPQQEQQRHEIDKNSLDTRMHLQFTGRSKEGVDQRRNRTALRKHEQRSDQKHDDKDRDQPILLSRNDVPNEFSDEPHSDFPVSSRPLLTKHARVARHKVQFPAVHRIKFPDIPTQERVTNRRKSANEQTHFLGGSRKQTALLLADLPMLVGELGMSYTNLGEMCRGSVKLIIRRMNSRTI
jgi:hypothetical protein